jgi:hypothetical protein
MSLKLLSCNGGHLVLPDQASLLVGAANGGNLVVLPPRPVWERSELSAAELRDWTFLVAAAGGSMLQVLPQLAGGCINYWEAGNWALNDAAEPKGRKQARDHRSVHLHLLGPRPIRRGGGASRRGFPISPNAVPQPRATIAWRPNRVGQSSRPRPCAFANTTA